jgi:hypothetical protein
LKQCLDLSGSFMRLWPGAQATSLLRLVAPAIQTGSSWLSWSNKTVSHGFSFESLTKNLAQLNKLATEALTSA